MFLLSAHRPSRFSQQVIDLCNALHENGALDDAPVIQMDKDGCRIQLIPVAHADETTYELGILIDNEAIHISRPRSAAAQISPQASDISKLTFSQYSELATAIFGACVTHHPAKNIAAFEACNNFTKTCAELLAKGVQKGGITKRHFADIVTQGMQKKLTETQEKEEIRKIIQPVFDFLKKHKLGEFKTGAGHDEIKTSATIDDVITMLHKREMIYFTQQTLRKRMAEGHFEGLMLLGTYSAEKPIVQIAFTKKAIKALMSSALGELIEKFYKKPEMIESVQIEADEAFSKVETYLDRRNEKLKSAEKAIPLWRRIIDLHRN